MKSIPISFYLTQGHFAEPIVCSGSSYVSIISFDRVHELGCYLETELSSYVGVLRARSTLQKERIRVRRMHGSASVGWPRHAYVMPAEHESNIFC